MGKTPKHKQQQHHHNASDDDDNDDSQSSQMRSGSDNDMDDFESDGNGSDFSGDSADFASDNDSDSDGEGDGDQESADEEHIQAKMEHVKSQLRQIPFEVLQKLQQDGTTRSQQKPTKTKNTKTNTKNNNNNNDFENGNESESENEKVKIVRAPQHHLAPRRQDRVNEMKARNEMRSAGEGGESAEKRDKSKPQELSSKFPVSRHREIFRSQTAATRDPRFSSLSGKFNEELFLKAYSFVPELEKQELEQARKALRGARGEQRRKLQEKVSLMQKNIDSISKRLESREKSQQLKRGERSNVKKGKKPYFLKKSDQRQLELINKFMKLKKTGQLNKFMEKRRRRNAAKAHTHMPEKA